jgi:multidrug resistance efflux pump
MIALQLTATKILLSAVKEIRALIMFATVITMIVAPSSLSFANEETLENDPYVVLFRTKLEEANSEASAKEANLALAQVRFRQIQRLISQGAATEDEYVQLKAALLVAQTELNAAKQRVLARKAMLDVVILNRLAGREVQQCL